MRPPELAAIAVFAAAVIGSFLPRTPPLERDGLRAYAAAGLVFVVVWFHIIPPRWFGVHRFTIGPAALQITAAGLLVGTGGVESPWFSFFLLPLLASVFRASASGTLVVAAFAFLGLAGTFALDVIVERATDTTAHVLIARLLGLSATAVVTVLVARTVERAQRQAEQLLIRLEQDATIDPLTELFNRRALEREVSAFESLAERTGRGFSVMVVDLDGLKGINDAHGHHLGDRAIRAVAEAIRREIRLYDVAARTGGDEFVVLLPEAAEDSAQALAARIAARVEAVGRHDARLGALGISYGIAMWRKGTSAEETLRTADARMYERKRTRSERVTRQ